MPEQRWLWMRPWALAGCAASALLTPFAPSLWWPFIVALGTLLALLASVHCARLSPWRPLAVALILGSCWGLLQGWLALRHSLPADCEGLDIWLQGVVWDLPDRRPASYPGGSAEVSQWTVRAVPLKSAASDHCVWPGGLIRIYWDDVLPVEPGEHWQLRARLRRPVYPLNPGSSDREAAMLHAGLRAVATAQVAHATPLPQSPPLRLLHQRLRWSLLQNIEALDLPSVQRAVIRALTLGDRSGLDEETNQTLRALGLSHLLVVSGLHIGMVAAWSWLIGSICGRGLNLAGLGLPAQVFAAATSVVASVIYAALAGFAVPTQRALVALVGASILQFSGGGFSAWQLLLLGLVCVAIIEPFAALSAGFWLSFAAVAVILWLRQWQPMLRGWRFVVCMQCLLALSLAPLSALWFGEFSWVAPLVNLIAVPVVSLWMVPLCLLAVVSAAVVNGSLAAWLWQLSMLPLHLSSKFSDHSLLKGLLAIEPQVLTVSPAVMFLLVLASAVLVLPLGYLRYLLVLVLAWPAMIKPRMPAEGTARLTVLDVGQGSVVVWQEPGYTLVYDVGGGDPEGSNAAQRIVLPFLRAQGIRRIDDVVISHADQDHVAGLAALLARLPVLHLHGENLPVDRQAQACRAGQSWRSPGAVFRYLSPAPDDGASRNDRSCVLLIEYGSFRALLPGDISRQREQDLLSYWRSDVRADWLMAAHHGSRSSSSATWIKWVEPRHVVFSAGYRSRFGHPHPTVVERFHAAGAQTYNTANHGALSFTVRANGQLEVSAERLLRARYWRD